MRRLAAQCLSLLLVFSFVAPAQDTASQEPKQRRRAARELADQGPDAIPKLRPLLSDSDLDVRIEAVKSIVQIDTDKSLDPLIQATRDSDPEIQIRAVDGLVNFYLPGYVKSGLTASLRRAGASVKGRFTETNDQVVDAYIQIRPEVVEALGKLARGGASMESRGNAARAVGILRGAAAVPDLLEAVKSKDSQVIYESLIALQKIRDRGAAEKIEFLLRDLDERVQAAAVETAGLLYNTHALPQLRDVLATSKRTKVRRAALASIAMLPDPENRELFLKYLQDKDENLRGSSAEGLGRIGEPADLPILEHAFQAEKKNSARVSVSFGLVMMGKLEMAELSPLQYLVNTLNSSLRAGIAKPLLTEAARKPEVRRALYPALRAGTKDEKIGLSQVMARSGDGDTLPVLEEVSHDSDADVAQEALRAFRSLKARLQ